MTDESALREAKADGMREAIRLVNRKIEEWEGRSEATSEQRDINPRTAYIAIMAASFIKHDIEEAATNLLMWDYPAPPNHLGLNK